MSIAKGSPNHKHAGGRPVKYKTVEELRKIINIYFAECDPHEAEIIYFRDEKMEDGSYKQVRGTKQIITEQIPYTMSGLARRIGLSREGLMEYKAKDQFSDTIKEARSIVQEFNERHLLSGRNVAGAIFNLKVNFGFKENIEENPPPDNPIIFINNVPFGEDPITVAKPSDEPSKPTP